ncbi:MAG: DUF2179 domain-containing protein [Candidatus Omnitrophica bacterium]|nr:DUF2179 domain-containing protein [Candidatus Omnitrophota bacterium]
MISALLSNETQIYQWVIIPLFIFFARVCDVSLDTVRIMLLTKGKRNLAPFLGFIQIMVWLLAIQQVFLNLSNVACYIAFAGGFATGTYVGMVIEEKLAIGTEVVRIITKKEAAELIDHLRVKGYGVTNIAANGSTGAVNVIYTIAKRTDVKAIISAIQKFNPNAFYTIEDIRSVNRGVFPS